MSSRKQERSQTQPDLAPERAAAELEQQLEKLQNLKGRRAHEVQAEEKEWTNYTEAVIAHSFGDPSRNLSKFHMAKVAGRHSLMGISQAQIDSNLAERIIAFEALLRSCIGELRLLLPAAEVAGACAAGEECEFYRDLKSLIQAAHQDLFVVDPYMNEEVFDLYVEKVARPVNVRILATDPSAKLLSVAQKFSKRGGFQLRRTGKIHDRHIFVDNRGWVIGQSIKDAAEKKPTYLVELNDPSPLRGIYEDIWNSAVIVL